jgi:predicted nuclease of predicted toxin-antitoxin system
MKLLIDMNLSPVWVSFFKEHGFQAFHWSNVGRATAPDTEIMEYAGAEGFVVFTHDLDFGRLLALGRGGGPSVVQIRTQDVLPAAVGSAVVSALNAARLHIDAGALVTIDLSSTGSGCCQSDFASTGAETLQGSAVNILMGQ